MASGGRTKDGRIRSISEPADGGDRGPGRRLPKRPSSDTETPGRRVRRKAPKKVYKVTQPVKPGAIERHQDRRNLMVLVKNLELGFQRATQLKNLTQSALDEAEGPDAAYIEVPDQGLADDRVFANRSAGDFVRHMIGLVETKDEMIKNLRQQGAETERLKREVRDYQLNLETTGQNDLISAQPAHRRQLLNMINKWLDVRVRAMYTFARDHNLINNAQIPQAMGDRISLLNTLVHGGDLYSDVLINYLNHMTSRHDAPTQQEMKRWYETVLPQIYGGLTLEPAGWILDKANQEFNSGNARWQQEVDFINKYVSVMDAEMKNLREELKNASGGALVRDIRSRMDRLTNTNRDFRTYIDFITNLCRREVGGQPITADLMRMLAIRRQAVLGTCGRWGAWGATTRKAVVSGWPPAAYLR